MNEQLPKDQLRDLLRELRSKHAGATTKDAELMAAAADCIEQLQMSPAKVRELARTEEGADTLALIRAMGMQIEGQRKHIATLESKLKRAEKTIDDLNDRFIEEHL